MSPGKATVFSNPETTQLISCKSNLTRGDWEKNKQKKKYDVIYKCLMVYDCYAQQAEKCFITVFSQGLQEPLVTSQQTLGIIQSNEDVDSGKKNAFKFFDGSEQKRGRLHPPYINIKGDNTKFGNVVTTHVL